MTLMQGEQGHGISCTTAVAVMRCLTVLLHTNICQSLCAFALNTAGIIMRYKDLLQPKPAQLSKVHVKQSLGHVKCMEAKEGQPEKGNSVDPFGLGVGGHLSPEGRAHGL